MSASVRMTSQPDMNVPEMPMETQVELIWQMGLVSLSSNNNELVLPAHMAEHLAPASIEDLKLKLTRHLGAPTIAFLDHETQSFRICRVPPRSQMGESASPFSSPASSNNSRSSATPAPDSRLANKSHSRGGKSAVPRPPNAFILYRKDRHPGLKQSHPEYHNNEISRILGKQWKAEPEAVHEEYKARAERIKQQHAIDNPGYQYAPRKPGDKKRRMTKKKLARLRRATSTNDVGGRVHPEEDGGHPSDLESGDDMPNSSTSADLPSAEDYIGSRRLPCVSHVNVNVDGNIEVILPSNNANIFSEVQGYQNQHNSYATVPFMPGSAHQVTTSTPQYVQNDDAFVNSLVDWDGIAEDVRQMKDATPETLDELADLEIGNPFLNLSNENARIAFQEELDRTLGFF